MQRQNNARRRKTAIHENLLFPISHRIHSVDRSVKDGWKIINWAREDASDYEVTYGPNNRHSVLADLRYMGLWGFLELLYWLTQSECCFFSVNRALIMISHGDNTVLNLIWIKIERRCEWRWNSYLLTKIISFPKHNFSSIPPRIPHQILSKLSHVDNEIVKCSGLESARQDWYRSVSSECGIGIIVCPFGRRWFDE